jgi:RNA polymerase sigma-70 factor (ECF subfamily)
MTESNTTVAVQRYLDELGGMGRQDPADPVVRALLDRAIKRLQQLCGTALHRSYPRLARAPLNLESEELLGAVVERLLKAMREVRPQTARQFFALASQHIRWELNDLARRSDRQTPVGQLGETPVSAPESSESGLSTNAVRMLEAIEQLPEEEREAFGLVRIQGLSHTEAAEVLSVSSKTIQRRLNRSLLLLTEKLSDLQ